ncbi:hypothetical protein TNCV_2250711 [Trichonephila clavipes]|nr:hypothetical protein TNCV_2250711 [Trichonephila clavipes]
MGRTNLLELAQSESVGQGNTPLSCDLDCGRAAPLAEKWAWKRISCSKSSLMEAPVDDQCIYHGELGPHSKLPADLR